jgi:hypothetical protein
VRSPSGSTPPPRLAFFAILDAHQLLGAVVMLAGVEGELCLNVLASSAVAVLGAVAMRELPPYSPGSAPSGSLLRRG